jgi:hypothetical protein
MARKFVERSGPLCRDELTINDTEALQHEGLGSKTFYIL